MEIEPGEGTLGAVVRGARLGALADDAWRGIEDAFHRFAVLVFPEAHLSEAEHITFSRRFGVLERTLSKRDERAEVSLLSNVDAGGTVAKPDDKLGLFLKGNRFWHTDFVVQEGGRQGVLAARGGGSGVRRRHRVGGHARRLGCARCRDPAALGRTDGGPFLRLVARPAGSAARPSSRSGNGMRCRRSSIRWCARIRRRGARACTSVATPRTSSAWNWRRAGRSCANSPPTPARAPRIFATIGGLAIWCCGTTAACCIAAIPGRSRNAA